MLREKNLKAQIEECNRSGEPTMFFVTKRGDVDAVSLRKEDAENEEVFAHLHEQAETPHFEICTVIKGAVQGDLLDCDASRLNEEELEEAITSAEDERIRFYTEREKEFGESAWPNGSRPAAAGKA
jgi:hypothetical protein